MKQFDISTLVVTQIRDVYGYTLEEETKARATTPHCALILRAEGESTYRVGGKIYTASADTLVFLPAGTEYQMEVAREGACTVIEFDVAETDSALPVCECYTDGEGEMAAAAKNLQLYWKLQGPAYRAKCMSELYGLLTQISTIAAEANSLVGKYGLIHKSVKYIERNYRREDLYTPDLAANVARPSFSFASSFFLVSLEANCSTSFTNRSAKITSQAGGIITSSSRSVRR